MSGPLGGAPEGNQNAAKGKRWRDAIEHCVERLPDGPDLENCLPLLRGLRMAASAFVETMIAQKDIAFFREFGDRIDGKALQAVELSGEVGNYVARAPAISPDAKTWAANHAPTCDNQPVKE